MDGGGKAGAQFDHTKFVQRPQVILRAACLLFAITVFGCISLHGYRYDWEEKKTVCLYNRDMNACNYGVGIGRFSILASIGFLVGEFMFEKMSSVKTRKYYLLGDLGFSAFWAFLYFVGFCYLANQWSKSATPDGGSGVHDLRAAITFSLLSTFTWSGCAWIAFQRFRQGKVEAYAPSYEADPASVLIADSFASYNVGQEDD
jgi:hypothetical protein